MRFWASWYQPTEDFRPKSDPPNPSILAWWNTGLRCSDQASTLVAWVEADSAAMAKERIQIDWPEAKEWRFCDPSNGWAISDRFPLDGWMARRVNQAMIREEAKVTDKVIDVGYGLSIRFNGENQQVWLCFDLVSSTQKASINMDSYAEVGISPSIVRKAIKQWCDEMRLIQFKK